MKKEFGKWLMDISKYMVTVILITTIFSDLGKWWIVAYATAIALLTAALGLWLLRDK